MKESYCDVEFKDHLQYLLDNKYVVIMDNKPVVTTNFEEAVAKLLDTTPEKPRKAQTVDGLTLKDLWNKFIIDAQIPHRVRNPQGQQYTIRHYTDAASKKLRQIVSDKSIDYNRLIAATKHYYAVTTYKKTLQNYLLGDIWLDEYKEYKVDAIIPTNDGSFSLED
jgi:hypothetical protein